MHPVNCRKFLVLTAILLVTWSQLQAASTEEEKDLLNILDDATQVVTHSKLNIDYTPSVVTVLEHQQLRSLGVKTLFEALFILPGVETFINFVGSKKVIFRGFDNPNNYAYDKAKLIIDGVPIETGLYGNTNYYLDLPTDIIERIEVLRGPGSALYGSGAFNGVINVVTRHDKETGNALFFSAGSYDYLLGGLRQHYTLGQNTALLTDLYYQRNRKMLPLGREFEVKNVVDHLSGDPIPFGRNLESDETQNDYSLGLTLTHQAWTFRTRYKDHKDGTYYGWIENLDMDADHFVKYRYIFTQIEYNKLLSLETSFNAKLGYSHFKGHVDQQSYSEVLPGTLSPYDFIIHVKEQHFNLDTSVTTSAVEAHTITAGAEFKTIREIDNSIHDDITIYGERALIKRGLKQNMLAFFARDIISLDESLTALLALRYECSGEDHRFYPGAQAGLVYTADNHWNFKLNYGHAFRIPSWLEQYSIQYDDAESTTRGNPGLTAETTDTFEAVAIYRSSEMHHAQFNIYYSILKNVLDIDSSDFESGGQYINRPNRTSYGVEMAYTLRTTRQNRLHLNFTYNQTSYLTPQNDIEQTMPGVAQVMAKGHYTHYLTPMFSLSTLVKYIGQRKAHEDFASPDSRADLDAYTTVDTSLNITNWHRWDIHATVKNMFNADVRYPSLYDQHPEGLPREGRNYLLQAEYTF